MASLPARFRTLLLISFGVLGLAGASPAAAQGFNPFAFLFGGSQPAREGRSVYTPAARSAPMYVDQGDYYSARRPRIHAPRAIGALDPNDPRLRREIARHHKSGGNPGNEVASHGSAGKMKPIAATPDAPNGSIALFMKDKTLRPGDVVVTNSGFRVYEGESRRPEPSDFVAVGGSDTDKVEKSHLIALENASHIKERVANDALAAATPAAQPASTSRSP